MRRSKINRNRGALSMTRKKEELVTEVIMQIKADLRIGDTTALELLLSKTPKALLKAFMPEH